MNLYFGAVFVSFLMITGAHESPKDWHEDVEWKTLEEALKLSQKEDKPIMLLIHKSWCGACKALKPRFHDSKEIGKLSENFIMVNAGDDDEPHDEQYRPDGKYIPRIFFIENGTVRTDLYNEAGNPKYKYFYSKPEHVINTMTKAVNLIGQATKTSLKEDL